MMGTCFLEMWKYRSPSSWPATLPGIKEGLRDGRTGRRSPSSAQEMALDGSRLELFQPSPLAKGSIESTPDCPDFAECPQAVYNKYMSSRKSNYFKHPCSFSKNNKNTESGVLSMSCGQPHHTESLLTHPHPHKDKGTGQITTACFPLI